MAEDLCGYFCVPADNRDLNYATFFSEGRAEVALKEDYNSHNTKWDVRTSAEAGLCPEGDARKQVKNLATNDTNKHE